MEITSSDHSPDAIWLHHAIRCIGVHLMPRNTVFHDVFMISDYESQLAQMRNYLQATMRYFLLLIQERFGVKINEPLAPTHDLWLMGRAILSPQRASIVVFEEMCAINVIKINHQSNIMRVTILSGLPEQCAKLVNNLVCARRVVTMCCAKQSNEAHMETLLEMQNDLKKLNINLAINSFDAPRDQVLREQSLAHWRTLLRHQYARDTVITNLTRICEGMVEIQHFTKTHNNVILVARMLIDNSSNLPYIDPLLLRRIYKWCMHLMCTDNIYINNQVLDYGTSQDTNLIVRGDGRVFVKWKHEINFTPRGSIDKLRTFDITSFVRCYTPLAYLCDNDAMPHLTTLDDNAHNNVPLLMHVTIMAHDTVICQCIHNISSMGTTQLMPCVDVCLILRRFLTLIHYRHMKTQLQITSRIGTLYRTGINKIHITATLLRPRPIYVHQIIYAHKKIMHKVPSGTYMPITLFWKEVEHILT